MSRLLKRDDLKDCRVFFELACMNSRLHSQLATMYLGEYGDHGSSISGCVRDHFPESVKDTLRSYAVNVTLMSDAAYAARPRRVRFATVRALGRAVAKRDGAGFYGPQP
jgi:hypothetical protein